MAKYELIQVGESTFTAAITNYSLSLGEKLHFIKTSQLSELVKIPYAKVVIYLAILGSNKNLHLPLNNFLDDYTPDDELMMKHYKNILEGCSKTKENRFAEGFRNSVDKTKGKGQKTILNPQLNIECVEDRYVLYTLVSGIDSDIFWYYPIPDVERIYESKQAFDSWKNSPKTQ